ncbi:MAG TPA: hypothetical protein VFG86_11960 [Chloroflexota bacterium]|nr:hypothetical protein [Chloroflexota bacterium]
MSRLLRGVASAIGSSSAALLIACGTAAPVAAQPLACDDGIRRHQLPGVRLSEAHHLGR